MWAPEGGSDSPSTSPTNPHLSPVAYLSQLLHSAIKFSILIGLIVDMVNISAWRRFILHLLCSVLILLLSLNSLYKGENGADTPLFLEPLQDCVADKGSDITLKGVITGSQPIRVSWLHNGELIEEKL